MFVLVGVFACWCAWARYTVRVPLVSSRQNDMTAEHENDTRVRLRRTKSVTRAEEIQKAEMMVRKSQPDKP